MPRRANAAVKTRRTALEIKVDGLIERVESLTLEVGSLAAVVAQAVVAASVPRASEMPVVGLPALGLPIDIPHARPVAEARASLGLGFNDAMAAELAEDEADDEPQTPDVGAVWDLWTRRLDLYRRNRMWQPDWGARPDQAACAAPRELLRENGFGGVG